MITAAAIGRQLRSFACIGLIETINFTRRRLAQTIDCMNRLSSMPLDESVEVAEGIALIRNLNTTIGYCRFTPCGDVEYIFVNPLYRRRGYGRRLLAAVCDATGRLGVPLAPISPMGRRFFGMSEAP